MALIYDDHQPLKLGLSLAVAVLLYLVYRFLLYPALLSPLCRIPNAHWSTSISSLWILRVRFERRENRTLLEVHRRLGPVVRIGPNELSVDGLDAVKTVYQGGFEKPEWYSIFDNYGVPCMFSTRPAREHALRKRMISNVYSKSFIQSSEACNAQARAILFDGLLPIIEESTSKSQAPHGIDVHSLFLATTMDFISAYIFGIAHSTDFLRRPAYREHWLQLYQTRARYPFFVQELPRLTRFCSRLRLGVFRLYPRWVDAANEELGEWNRRLCTATLASGAVAPGFAPESPADEPVVMKALLSGLAKEAEANGEDSILHDTALRHHDLSVASELFDHVLAGQETAGITLTYLVWQLSKDAALQDRLFDELTRLDPNTSMRLKTGSTSGAVNPKALDSLELLHAVVTETLRLHAAIPGPQPRQTPSPSCRIGPFTVPGGVRIAAGAHTLHRDEGVFPDPEKWDHTRWLASTGVDEEARKARNRQFWAFSSGGRMCIGSNFAMNEMKLIIAAIYSNFKTHIVDDAGMEQEDGYTVGPRSGRLYVRFEPRH